MKISKLWGVLLLIFIIPIYGQDCETCHKHRHHQSQMECSSYDSGDNPIVQDRGGYRLAKSPIHTANYQDNIDRANRANAEPFGPQDFEDYGDSTYEEYNEPYDDYVQFSVLTNINAATDYDENYNENCPERYLNYPYEEYIRYSVSTDGNKIPTYVDYFPTLRGFPYYIGHQSGPFFGNGYGGF